MFSQALHTFLIRDCQAGRITEAFKSTAPDKNWFSGTIQEPNNQQPADQQPYLPFLRLPPTLFVFIEPIVESGK